MQWLSRIEIPDIYGGIEIICLALVFYYVFFFFRGTRVTPVLTGFVLIFVVLITLTNYWHLDSLNWVLGRFSVYLAVAFLIVFQPEIRWALGELGKQHLLGSAVSDQTLVDNLVQAVTLLMKRRIGALIAVERTIGTRPIQETGVMINSLVSPELLASIFYPYTPLHDGGVIISGNRIVAARCMFPLTQKNDSSRKTIGARHRAAIGLTDEIDAVVIVVSEETGMVSVCHDGRLIQDLGLVELKNVLSDLILKSQPGGRWRWVRSFRNLFASDSKG
jgi:diadenylate cyclase